MFNSPFGKKEDNSNLVDFDNSEVVFIADAFSEHYVGGARS